MSEEGRIVLIETARRMNSSGLNRGIAGNLSLRIEDGFLITPTGMDYGVLEPADIVLMRMDGSHEGRRAPSSEWRFHRDILASRPEIDAVLHAHPMFSTVLACQRREIPAFHYMIARAGGSTIRCAPYATFGGEDLSRHAVAALEDRLACLLANHGLIAIGATLDGAFRLALEIEELAEMYWRSLQAGPPVILDEDEMSRIVEKFKSYGKQPSSELTLQ